MTWLALALLLGAPAFAVDSGDIVISAVKGDVRVTMNGVVRDVRAGSVLELPASVRTGRDGALELEQGATSISVGPETQLDFPAPEKRGAPVDRIVQPRGNAFYDIGKREGRKLRVETPYLVGVIKGTQFNVAAQEDSTTISLFEGRLEVRDSDAGDPIDLQAGEIASRRRGDLSISVIKMNEKAPAVAPVPKTQNRGNVNSGGDVLAVTSRAEARDLLSEDSLVSALATSPSIVTVDEPAVQVSVAGDLANVGPIDVDVGTATDLAAGANPTTGDAGLGAVVDTGVAVDVGVSDVATVDAGSGVAVNTGAGAIDVAVDTGANLPGVDTGVSAGVDLGPGAVDVGLNPGDVDVDLGADLGLDDDGNNGHGNDPDGSDASNPGNSRPSRPGNLIDDVGGLLDGLVRRPKRR